MWSQTLVGIIVFVHVNNAGAECFPLVYIKVDLEFYETRIKRVEEQEPPDLTTQEQKLKAIVWIESSSSIRGIRNEKLSTVSDDIQ